MERYNPTLRIRFSDGTTYNLNAYKIKGEAFPLYRGNVDMRHASEIADLRDFVPGQPLVFRVEVFTPFKRAYVYVLSKSPRYPIYCRKNVPFEKVLPLMDK